MRGALLLLALLLLPQAAPPVERDSLAGKVLCGYQGWFSAEGDGG
jgi:hypothetical protein